MSVASPRVIFVNRVYHPSTAATAQLLSDLAEGLAARGWRVGVIAAGEGVASRHGVTIHRTGGADRHGGLISRAINYGRIRREARRLLASLVEPGDVVVPMTDPPMLGVAVTRVVQARGGRIVPWVQDIYPEILSAHVGRWADLPLGLLRVRRNAAWQGAARCVTLGEAMGETLRASGVPPDRIDLVPNWAPRELETFPPAEAVAARRLAWNVTDKFVLAYSGNLGRVHEFGAVIEAATQLRARSDLVFLFIGSGARFEEVRSSAQARGLTNVRLLPPEPRENLSAALAAADVHLVTLKPAFAGLVYPSKLAGVLAAARPVLFVGPPECEIPRLLARAGCGAAVGPADGGSLAALITRWREDAAKTTELGGKARRVYEQHFTFGHALARWEEILRAAAR